MEPLSEEKIKLAIAHTTRQGDNHVTAYKLLSWLQEMDDVDLVIGDFEFVQEYLSLHGYPQEPPQAKRKKAQ